jgi:hypothetical protein
VCERVRDVEGQVCRAIRHQLTRRCCYADLKVRARLRDDLIDEELDFVGMRPNGHKPSGRWRLAYGHWTGAVKPPSPPVSGELPTVAGIRPLIGPPLAAPAGVEST